MYTIKELFGIIQTNHVEYDGSWYSARPIPPELRRRIKDAWLVLIGRADAVRWPKGQ